MGKDKMNALKGEGINLRRSPKLGDDLYYNHFLFW